MIKIRNNEVEKISEPLDAVACPLFLSDRLSGVVAVEMTIRSQPMQQATAQQVQTGAKWFETMVLLHSSTGRAQMVNLVDLVAAGLEHEQFRVAATELTNELAEHRDCQQVSLGFLRYNRVRVEALSHSSRIDQHSNLVRAIQGAMNESLDQGTAVVCPAKSDVPLIHSDPRNSSLPCWCIQFVRYGSIWVRRILYEHLYVECR